jgi:hypothetical protein
VKRYSRRSIISLVIVALILASIPACSATVAKKQTTVYSCANCGTELSRVEREVQVPRDDAKTFPALVEDRSTTCPIEWAAFTNCNQTTLSTLTTVKEVLVNAEPQVVLSCPGKPADVNLVIGSVSLQQMPSGEYQAPRIEVLTSLAAAGWNGMKLPVTYMREDVSLGTVGLTSTISTETYMTIPTSPPSKTWSSLVTISGSCSPGATVSCLGKSSVGDTVGTFSLQVPLSSVGSHELTVTAQRSGESQSQNTFTVERLPNVVVEDPSKTVSSGVVTVTGVVNPDYTVEVKGTKYDVSSSGSFIANVTLSDGEKTYSIPVVVKSGSSVVYNKSYTVSYVGPITKAAVSAYAAKVGELSSDFAEYFGDLGALLQNANVFSNDWIMSVAYNVAMMRILMDDHKELVPPTPLAETHKTLLKAWVEYEASFTLLLAGIDSLSTSKILAADVRMKKGTAYIKQANDMMVEVARGL